MWYDVYLRKRKRTPMTTMENSYFECSCHSTEHTVKVCYDPYDKDLYLEVQLCQTKNFFQRVWSAIKYILGYKCKYGHWDCFLFTQETAKEFTRILKVYTNETPVYSPTNIMMQSDLVYYVLKNGEKRIIKNRKGDTYKGSIDQKDVERIVYECPGYTEVHINS